MKGNDSACHSVSLKRATLKLGRTRQEIIWIWSPKVIYNNFGAQLCSEMTKLHFQTFREIQKGERRIRNVTALWKIVGGVLLKEDKLIIENLERDLQAQRTNNVFNQL